MSQASLFDAHTVRSQFTHAVQPQRSASVSSPERGGNYLPGLRPIRNELDAYFADEYVWLNS